MIKMSRILTLACLLSWCSDCSAAEDSKRFRLFACLDWPEGMTLVFKNASSATRMVSFGDAEKEFALESPTGKGLLKWRNAIAIHVVPSDSGNGLYLMAIEYRDNIGGTIEVFEAGLIDDPCLSKVRARYGASFKFDEKWKSI